MRHRLLALIVISLGFAAAAQDYADWAVDPTNPGTHVPAHGRSLFDYLVTERVGDRREYRVPFPFTALQERIQNRLAQIEYGGGTRVAMLPMGRSLQRGAAAPDFFKFPRIVFAVTGEPKTSDADPGMLLKDRLYIGYVESTQMLEVISYNEAAGRYEFQFVKDYREGATPKVYYANRAICIACHQNHAPIFSKAVWSETNANSRVAELLAQSRSDFYTLPPQANLDFPDDIGQSTVRANALVTAQSLWQRGCAGDDQAQARRCRAAALLAVLQFGLSGEHDFAANQAQFQQDFVTNFGATWRQRWPQGLRVAQAELPDRSPLGGGVGNYGAASAAPTVTDLIAAAHVPPALDPLLPRGAREVLRFSSGLDAQRYIRAWSQFFAPADFLSIDAQLAQRRAQKSETLRYRANCNVTANTHSAYTLKLDCDAASPHALSLRGRVTPEGAGLIDLLNLAPLGQVRDAMLQTAQTQRAKSDVMLPVTLSRGQLNARLADGRAVTNAVLRWPAVSGKSLRVGAKVRLELEVVDDFALVRTAVEALLREQPQLFDAAPLARAALMNALSAQLGIAARDWCCVDAQDMPAPTMEVAAGPDTANMPAPWQPFYRHCATCHLSAERFPPNFLSGDRARVEENLRRCAPRMLVRLDAWQRAPAQRTKSPMPPETFLSALGIHAAKWADSDDLKALRSYIESLLPAQRSTVDELMRDGYEALPICAL